MSKLVSVRLLVDDFPAMFRFYRDVMKFPVLWGDENGPYGEFRASEDVSLALFVRELMAGILAQEAGEVQADDRVSLIFHAEDVDKDFAEVSARSRPVTTPKDRPEWGVRTAHIRDPEDFLLEINRGIEDEASE